MATLEDKPYVDLKISDKTGYEISGIFGDVFCDLKVNYFSGCLLLLKPYSYHQIPGINLGILKLDFFNFSKANVKT